MSFPSESSTRNWSFCLWNSKKFPISPGWNMVLDETGFSDVKFTRTRREGDEKKVFFGDNNPFVWFLLFSKFARGVIQNPWAISLGLINLFLFILPELFVTFTLGSAAFCLFWFHQGYLLLLRFHLQPCGKRRNQNVLAVTGWFNFNRWFFYFFFF